MFEKGLKSSHITLQLAENCVVKNRNVGMNMRLIYKPKKKTTHTKKLYNKICIYYSFIMLTYNM